MAETRFPAVVMYISSPKLPSGNASIADAAVAAADAADVAVAEAAFALALALALAASLRKTSSSFSSPCQICVRGRLGHSSTRWRHGRTTRTLREADAVSL